MRVKRSLNVGHKVFLHLGIGKGAATYCNRSFSPTRKMFAAELTLSNVSNFGSKGDTSFPNLFVAYISLCSCNTPRWWRKPE